MKLVIDNTSTPGTFFDNIHNPNWVVNEYDIDDPKDIENFKDEIDKSSKVYIKPDLVDENGLVHYEINSMYSTTKYDYINENNIDSFRTPYYDKIFKTINDAFTLSKEQYNTWLVYQKKHQDCRVDKKTGKRKFGTIGGGSSLIFQINYCSEELFPRFGFLCARCEGCMKTSKLTTTNKPVENLDEKYESFKKFGFKLNLVEFYRFIEIYNEYKTTIELGFMGTGLGDLKSVKVKDYVFSITDTTHW